MKRKINIQLISISILAILVTTCMSIIVFYKIFHKQALTELKNYTNIILNNEVIQSSLKNIEYISNANLELYVVDNENNLMYSNIDNEDVEIGKEVEVARKKGEGSELRYSKLERVTRIYYAVKIQQENMIIVTSMELESIVHIMIKLFPSVFPISIIMIIICIIAAQVMTKKIMRPIEEMANDLAGQEISSYKEIQPFLSTIKKQHEDILKSAMMRQEFTANVSHELKTPLTSISGYAELIETGMVQGEDAKRFASEIGQNAKRLLALINDTIQLAEIDNRNFKIELKDIDLYEIAKNSIRMVTPSADKLGITISLEGEVCILPGNKELVEEVVYNLCDNAIRYNNKNGRVDIKVVNQNDYGIIIIKDTGIGISKEDQERIFERFYRVDRSRSKATGGTGLGLAIVKHILVKHKATINLKSEVGEGTEVKIVFPKNNNQDNIVNE